MKFSKSRQSLQFVLVTALFLLLSACGADVEPVDKTPGVTKDEILIGSSSALSGHASFLGTQYTHGALAWFREVNAGGGIHSRMIKLISYDDQYDPPQTVANTQKLIAEDQVFMLFNYVGTPTSVKIIEPVHEAKIPAFGFFTGAEPLRTPFRPYMLHLRASYYAEAEAAVAYFADQLGLSRIAVMYQDDAFGKAVLKGVELALRRRNLPIAATGTYTRGQLDVDKAVDIIRESEAEAIVMVGTYTPLARFIKLCHAVDYQPYFHTVSFVGSEAFAGEILQQEIAPTHFEQIIVTQVVPSPYSVQFPTVAEYRKLAGKYFPEDEPNFVALEGFLNARVLTKALEAAGQNLTRSKIRLMFERMRDTDVGIGKALSYGPLDHSGLEDVYYSRLGDDGIFQIFDPE
jgi:ABC-type branched-subunit amino acid transport system substrate-binding protein